MELKRKSKIRQRAPSRTLLIVPYGIETFDVADIPFPVSLLIVPYGIETIKFLEPAPTL